MSEKDYNQMVINAKLVIEKKGLGDQKARVASSLDISGSMTGLYESGTVQTLTERLLALGARFDDNNAIDMFAFGVRAHNLGELPEADFKDFVAREITGKHSLEGGTSYAGVMKMIVEHYFPGAMELKKTGGVFSPKKLTVTRQTNPGDPVYVMFITDGNNDDPGETEAVIVAASELPIFWQFVGIGDASFGFLKKLDDMEGRFVDNANFFEVNDIQSIGDEDLYGRLLGEFPEWLQKAKQLNLY